MSDAKGIYRTVKDGTDIAYIDKGVGVPLGVTRERYEASGYEPSFDKLPEK